VVLISFYDKETYIMEASVDGVDGNDGGGGWCTSASTLDGCNGRGGADT
jgi:hypothetical protein